MSSNLKLSPDDFATRIKAKYPGMYDDLDNTTLTRRILSKHNQYKDMVDLPDLDKPLDFDTISNEAHNHGLQITSNKRTPEHNKAVGGVANSYHLSGQAFDIAGSPEQQEKFYNYMRDTYGGRFAEILNEGDHIHIASEFKPEQNKTINNITNNSSNSSKNLIRMAGINSNFNYQSPKTFNKQTSINIDNKLKEINTTLDSLIQNQTKLKEHGFPTDAIDREIRYYSQAKNDLLRVSSNKNIESISKQSPSEQGRTPDDPNKLPWYLKGYAADIGYGGQAVVNTLAKAATGVGRSLGLKPNEKHIENIRRLDSMLAETQARGGEGIGHEIVRGASSMATHLPLYAAGGIAGAAALGAAETAGDVEPASVREVVKSAVLNASMMGILKAGHRFTLPKRMLLGAATGSGTAAISGGSREQIISQGLLFGGLGALGEKGKELNKEVESEGIEPKIGNIIEVEGRKLRISDINKDNIEFEVVGELGTKRSKTLSKVNLLGENRAKVDKIIEDNVIDNKDSSTGPGYRLSNEDIETFHTRLMKQTDPSRRVSLEQFKEDYNKSIEQGYGPEPGDKINIKPELEAQLGKGKPSIIPTQEMIDKGFPAYDPNKLKQIEPKYTKEESINLIGNDSLEGLEKDIEYTSKSKPIDRLINNIKDITRKGEEGLTPEGSGSSVISNEELNRNETFYKVTKSGNLTYQGKQPDNLSLKPDEAIIAVNKNGEMRVSNGDVNLLDKYGSKVKEANKPESINNNNIEPIDIAIDEDIPINRKGITSPEENTKKIESIKQNKDNTSELTKDEQFYKKNTLDHFNIAKEKGQVINLTPDVEAVEQPQLYAKSPEHKTYNILHEPTGTTAKLSDSIRESDPLFQPLWEKAFPDTPNDYIYFDEISSVIKQKGGAKKVLEAAKNLADKKGKDLLGWIEPEVYGYIDPQTLKGIYEKAGFEVKGEALKYKAKRLESIKELESPSVGAANLSTHKINTREQFLNDIKSTNFDDYNFNNTEIGKHNIKSLDNAFSGKPLDITGFRQQRERSAKGIGTFYTTHPGNTWQFLHPDITENLSNFDKLTGGPKDTLKIDKLQFENPLIINAEKGNVENISEYYNQIPRITRIEIDIIEHSDSLNLDRNLATIAKNKGYDAIIYKSNKHVGLLKHLETEIQDLRSNVGDNLTAKVGEYHDNYTKYKLPEDELIPIEESLPDKSVGAAAPGQFPTTPDIKQLQTDIETRTSSFKPIKKDYTFGEKTKKIFDKIEDSINNSITKLKDFTNKTWENYKSPAIVNDFTRSVDKWQGSKQEGLLYSKQFSASIKKQIPSQLTRDAITRYIDSGGDRTILLEGSLRSPDPLSRKAYQEALNLKPEYIDIANNISSFYDAMLQKGQDAGILWSQAENYVNRVYDRDNAKLINSQIQSDLQQGKLPTTFQHSKRRFYQYLLDAEMKGLKPKVTDVSDLVSIYNAEFNNTLAAREFVKNSMNAIAPDGRPVIVVLGTKANQTSPVTGTNYDIIRPAGKKNAFNPNYPQLVVDTKGYDSRNYPGFNQWKMLEYNEDKPVFVEAQLGIHPDFIKEFDNRFKKSAFEENTVLKGIKTTKGNIKSFKMAGSLFHQAHVDLHALAHRVFNPYKGFSKPIDLESPMNKKAIASGVKIIDERGLAAFTEGVASGDLVHKIPLAGKILEKYTSWLFEDHIPKLKLLHFPDAYERNMKAYDKDIQNGKVTEEQIAKLTAQEVNASFGELNYEQMGTSKTAQDLWGFVLLAPDFSRARLQYVKQALKPYGREQRIALVGSAIAMYTTARILNAFGNDGNTFADDPEHAFDVKVGDKWIGLRSVPGDILHVSSVPGQALVDRLNPVIQSAVTYSYGVNRFGDKISPDTKIDRFKESGKQFIPMSIDTEDFQKSMLSAMGLAVRKFTPKAQKDYFERKNELYDETQVKHPDWSRKKVENAVDNEIRKVFHTQ
jgi:hypothetical protein